MSKRIVERLALSVSLALLLLMHPASSQVKQQAAAEPQGTAEVKGVLTVSRRAESPAERAPDALRARYGSHSSHDAMVVAGQPPEAIWTRSERMVVYLESLTNELWAFPVPERHPVLDQKNLEFHPRVLPILVGTTVDFPNRDNLFHNVFSYSQPKEFDLGRYPRNDSRSVTFDEPGVVRVYCDIHAHMNATILVLQNPYFAVPTEDGAYVIRHVPKGKYSVVFWCDREIVERRTIDVKEGETVVANFIL